MKIAFTSCANFQDYSSQPGWKRIQALAPDVLLLLGDQIYMDFGLPALGGDLYAPSKFSLGEFAFRMYDRYRQQFAEAHFHALLTTRKEMKVAAVWDDHDFAWNNACGGRCPELKPGEPETRMTEDGKLHKVSDWHKAVARALFMQFLGAVRDRDAAYPKPPFDFATLPEGLATTQQGIQESFDLAAGTIRVVLLDTRYHRDCYLYPDARIMDEAQMSWLREQLDGPQELTLICSGSTLTSAESWDDYPSSLDDLKRAAAGKRVLVLSGDIHQNDFRVHKNPHDKNLPLFEAIASGLAVKGLKPFVYLGDQENFGLLEIDDARLRITLHRKSRKFDEHLINRATWRAETA